MSPRPNTRPSRPIFRGYRGQPRDYSQAPERLWRRLYIRGVEEGLEALSGYRPGGYHPIHLQDELHGGRYRVIHKLGHGGFSTVWLCRDQKVDALAYVAAKIFIASETGKADAAHEITLSSHLPGVADEHRGGRYLCSILDQFESQSPNGTHVCLVYPVLGPTVDQAAHIFGKEENTVGLLRHISHQAAEAMAALHIRGICHADFRPSNVLLEVEDLNGLDEQDVIARLGEPETTDIHVRQDSRPSPEIPYAPGYLVYPGEIDNVEHLLNPPRIRIIDLGQSFDTTQQMPQPLAFGIPANYAAPEVVLDSRGGTGVDLWSLGCTLYEIRLGRRLFDVFQLVTLTKRNYVDEISILLGRPPGKWEEFYRDSPDAQTSGLTQVTQPARAIFDRITGRSGSACMEGVAETHHQPISDDEAQALADLLGKLLRYEPDERLDAQDVVKHAWFSI